jgi:flagellin-like hook-associated protein FlgL
MRVTSNLMFSNGMTALQDKQQELMAVQEKSLTGNDINRPSDDPTSVYRHMLFSADLSGVQSLMHTTEFASQRISLADDQLGQMHERMLEAQELVMKMSGSSVGGQPEILVAASEEAEAIYQELITNINTELDEVPIFGGGRTRSPYDQDIVDATAVRVQTNGEGSLSMANTNIKASVDEDHTLSDMPLSVKVSYQSSDDEYEVDINGVKQEPNVVATGNPLTLDLGNGLNLEMGATPESGDVFYFEVVAAYQGGTKDRAVQVMNGRTLPGNSTAEEILEGSGSAGREVNVLGAVAALRGALLRGDTTEVAVQLDRIQEGRAQISDLQAISGIRVTQVNAVNNTLALNESSITEMKATNVEADLVEVLSNLEQTSQAMQVMTITERQVLNTSLIDFIR